MEQAGLKISKKTIRILVLGKDGSGKSTLINNILEEELAPESHELVTVSCNKGMIEQHIKTINDTGTEVIMYDTTGIDRDKNGLIREIQRHGGIELFDVVLFCCSSLQRIDPETDSLVALLNNIFGKRLWNKTILVLTYVNLFLSLHSVRIHLVDEARVEATEQLTSSLKEHIKLRTSISFFNKIPVVLAGCEKNELPVISNWRMNMWYCCSHLVKANVSSIDFWKIIRAQSMWDNNNDQLFKNISREVLVGATTGAFVGTAISPGMGTVLISATGAVIGGVSAVYSNRKTRQAIRIVNSITVSEDLCEEIDYNEKKPASMWSSESMAMRQKLKETSSTVIKVTNSTVIQRSNESSIGNFAEEIFQHFSISS